MIKKLLFVLLVSSTFAQAQVYQTYSMLFVRVEGDQNAFEELQDKYMVRAAQAAVDKGEIAFWAFLRHVNFDYINDENNYNYVFVQSNKDIDALLSDRNKWWTRNDAFFSNEEQAAIEALEEKFTWAADTQMIFVDETSIALGLGTHIQFNFAKPENINAFIEANKNVWRPHFEKIMSEIGMLNWGVGRSLGPWGKDYPTVSTWDMFDSLENLMKYRIGHPLPDSVLEQVARGEAGGPVDWMAQLIFEAKNFAVADP